MSIAATHLELGDKILQRRQIGKRALGHSLVDPHQILHDDAAGAEIGVADLRIAHLAVGQSDIMLAGVEMRMRPAPHQFVPYRRLRPLDRVVVAIVTFAPAVEDAQHERARADGHRGVTPTYGERPMYTRTRAACGSAAVTRPNPD